LYMIQGTFFATTLVPCSCFSASEEWCPSRRTLNSSAPTPALISEELALFCWPPRSDISTDLNGNGPTSATPNCIRHLVLTQPKALPITNADADRDLTKSLIPQRNRTCTLRPWAETVELLWWSPGLTVPRRVDFWKRRGDAMRQNRLMQKHTANPRSHPCARYGKRHHNAGGPVISKLLFM